MSTLVNWNGQQYLVPAYNDTGYAQGNGNLSQYLVALSTGSLQQVGGLFQLTADADFGPNFGLVSSYFKSRSANIASAGVLRLANTDAIKWRNSDNSADVTLAMNATGTAARTYTIPDISNSSFVMTEGTQTINGAKTISDLRGTLGANLAAGGFKLTGLAAGSGNGDSLRYEQLVGAYLPLGGGTLTGALLLADGAAATPSLSFGTDTDTGIYLRASGNGLAFAFNATMIASLSDTGGTTFHTGPVAVVDGSAATPPLTFLNDRDTGWFGSSNNGMYFSSGGTQRGYFLGDNINWASGSAAAPTYTFSADTDTGLYRVGANTLGISTNGVQAAYISDSSFVSALRFYAPDGTGASPSISFSSDSNNGLYLVGADDWALVRGGAIKIRLDSAGYIGISDSLTPQGTTGTLNIGNSINYWNDISYKTITDRGCLPFCDDGVELSDGKIVSDTEAIRAIQKHPTKKTIQGLPMLDYKTFPKKSYKPADDKGVLLPRDENDEPIGGSDGVEMTMMFGVMIGAIKELTDRIEKLEKK